jgi:predicted metal-dependent hydrolase
MSEIKEQKSSLKIPKFASEAEEARWWFENEDLIAKEFEKAAAEGRLKRGGVRRLLAERGIPLPESVKTPTTSPTPTTTIRLDPEDIDKAREQAAERGLRYQTYLKMLIREALRKAEQERKAS